MSRTAKIAGVAAVAGLMMAVAIATAIDPSAKRPIQAAASSDGPDPLARELARCRALTVPDIGCDAAWEASRSRFLGNSEDRR
ncbi:putative entry exclusion protein TrbK-alt [Sphingomonas sp.]|uniref:putative entry exclusion protein TrbK-alt n=1 Tax=Sphingomonas sp. TaxID=28214 RepID=UPI0025DC2652|nr:putative entry exclusion protein TrbK-alt [Sphingomonas sp.]